MSLSTAQEKKAAVAYLGPPATWTHQAAREKFGDRAEYLPQTHIGAVFEEVSRHRAVYGVVPAENSTEGIIAHTFDMFVDYDVRICGQVPLRIEHNLLGLGDRAKITRLYSHAQVFGQCRDWLNREMPGVEKIEVSSTSRASDLATHESNSGALASRLAAEIYQLPILAAAIQDKADNTTRFFVIGQENCPRTGLDRTSIMFGLRDGAGGPLEALRLFDQLKVGLRKIESRPTRRKAWDYYFFVEVDGHQEDESIMAVVDELKKNCPVVKVLGSYPDNE